MQGLELSRAYFAQCARPLLAECLPLFLEQAAIGLVGEGSECFGFDDEISQDHDWGPAFCLWLPQAEWGEWLDSVEDVLALLPQEFHGHAARMRPQDRAGRVGPLAIEQFYGRFTNLPEPPQHWRQWRAIPEHFLAVATNGAVFHDARGMFTQYREALLAYYPEDLRLKKIAARCMGMAQAGQYNLPRSLQRGEQGAAMLAAARFAEAALSMTYLLNKRYMPFYKWAHRGVRALPLLGEATWQCVQALAALRWDKGPAVQEEAAAVVETLCVQVADSLRAQGLSTAEGAWLLAHGPAVQSRIATPELRRMPEMLE